MFKELAKEYTLVKKKKPEPFDLCRIIGKNGLDVAGWYCGNSHWDGKHIDKIDEVLAWKKVKYTYEHR